MIDPGQVLILMGQLLWTYAILFGFCELGSRITNGFIEMQEKFSQLDWYLLPIKIQRNLPFIIEGTQQSVFIQCFNQYFCTRDSFKEVRNLFKAF